jgi:hypothetical protein
VLEVETDAMFGSGTPRGVEFVPVAGEVFEVEGVVALGGIVALGSVAMVREV